MTSFIYIYDTWFIFIAAIVNIILFVVTLCNLKGGRRTINPETSLRFNIDVPKEISPEKAHELQKKRDRVVVTYSAFSNVTAIFPLLGILGTVAALIQHSQEADMMKNLMVALDTTLYGAICAIISKIGDAFISGRIDSFVDDADYLIRHCEDDEVTGDEK